MLPCVSRALRFFSSIIVPFSLPDTHARPRVSVKISPVPELCLKESSVFSSRSIRTDQSVPILPP